MSGGAVKETISERALFAAIAEVESPTQPPAGSPPTQLTLQKAAWRHRTIPPWQTLARGSISALTLETERGILFLLAPAVMVCGVLAYLALPIEPSLWALGVVVAVLAPLVRLARDRPLLRMGFGAMLIFMIGATCACMETWRASTKMIGAEITTRLTGRVVEIDHLANGRIRLTLDILRTERPTLRFAPDRVRVSAASVPAGIIAGSTVSGAARLFPPSGPLRPQSYDFSFESYFDRLGGNGFFFTKPELVGNGEDSASIAASVRDSIDNFRNRIAAHVRDKVDGPEGEIAAALIVGVRAGFPEPVNESLRRTGLAHILSISGLHMALVAASIMGGMRLAFAVFPQFASRWPVKKLAAATALTGVAAYLLVSGAEVAAQRSFIMLAVMLVAVMFDRAALTMRNLAISALVVIAISPHEVVGPSFQMSFAATAALIGGYALWSERREAKTIIVHHGLFRLIATKMAKVVVGVALTALIAGLATTIYGAWHFQRVSPLSLVANLAVTPIISLVMWAAVFAAVAMPFGLDGPLLSVMDWGLAMMLSIADWLSARSPLDAIGLVPVGAVIVLTLTLLVATFATTRIRLAALPLAGLGLYLLADRPLPDMLVSEDGRLVAVRTPDGNLAVNRARPNGFTIDDWQRALVAREVVKPSMSGDGDRKARFACADGLCSILHRSGAMILYVDDATNVAANCETATVIVVSDPSARSVCGQTQALVVTARELARRGTAAARIEKTLQGFDIETDFAVRQPYRPWHDHRRFSRAARGLKPYQEAKTAADR